MAAPRGALESEIRSLKKLLAGEQERSHSVIEQFTKTTERLTSANQRLANKVAVLTDEVARLRAQLARALGQSPETPSGQVPPFLKPPRANCGIKPGRKRGHPGARRTPPKPPDRQEQHSLKNCPHCEGPVRPVRGPGFEPVARIRYVEDILPGKPEVTQHTIHQYWCRGCKRKVEGVVTAALPGATIGLKVVVWSAVQHYVHGLPAAKIVAMLRQDYGFAITEGGLHSCWHQLSDLAHFEYERILHRVRQGGVLHADETGWRINGSMAWLWCFTTKNDVGYFIDRTRSASVATMILGENFDGTLIQDFYAAYNACNARQTQYCIAHLLREFKKIEVRDGERVSPEFKSFKDRVTRIFREAIAFHRESPDPPAREAARNRFERRLLSVLEEPANDKDVVRLTSRFWRSAHGLFTFLTTEGVDPTNNHAERQIRAAVVMRKIAGGSRSDHGANTRAILMSVFRTQQLQGQDPVTATIELVKRQIIKRHNEKRPRSASLR